MLVLGLDTATPAITTAVAEVTADRVMPRAEQTTVDARAHGERLAPQIAAVLAEAGVTAAGLAAVVAGTGPGPFTGLRVGLATAAAMAQALAVPAYGVCSLDAIAAAGQWSDRLLVATDARRREVYWAVYTGEGERVTEPAVDAPAVVAGHAARLGVGVALGEGAHRFADQFGVRVLEEGHYPSAYAIIGLAADRVRSRAPAEPLQPRYLRRPDVRVPR